MLEDSIQKLETFTIDVFQLFFFENLFGRNEERKIQNDKSLTRKQLKHC